MRRAILNVSILLLAAITLSGCATPARPLMPTPLVYRQPGGLPLFSQSGNQLHRLPDGLIERDRDGLARHAAAKSELTQAVERRLERSRSKQIMLYVHGFNETFATAAYTAAELCHVLGREDVCTWC